MKAIIFNRTGNAKEVLSIANKEIPICRDNEVLIKMIKSPINPADILFIAGKYRYKPSSDQIVGFEGVGIIEDIGINKDLSKGMLVTFRHYNTWAEYVTVPSNKLTILPNDFPIDKASQFTLNPITAQALIEESDLKSTDWIVLTAGASSVSKLIIQLLQNKGIKIIAIIRNPKDSDILRMLGVDAILNTNDNVKEVIPTIVKNDRLQAVIDAVGGSQTSDLIKVISANGRLLLYGLQSQDNVQFHNADLIFKNITVSGFGIDNWISKQSAESLFSLKQTLINRIQKNDFKMPVDSTWQMENFKDAFNRFDSNNIAGKVLLSFT